ncbi:hypothetical protein PAXRUDRAFT_28442 [Paxillus rubicundulus Ve08.2h10]|uniref:Uncharacterized protein n=1 Tax=Paxillus rubicundulus Ve08.2h10 TaxID=930991 RepID=A0A0D0CV27_9AGAM|nr:hypothetical protein PAXRUDRAFT_28442 [Paxillus rubicundulus Ve08.2h10]
MADNMVRAIIDRYTGNGGMQLRPRAKVTPGAAKKEAFSGFRENTAASSSLPKSRNINCQTRSASRPLHQEKLIKIGTLTIATHGLTESTGKTGNLRMKKKPARSELETYLRVGLIVGADGEKDLEFNISWSMVDIDMRFQRLFPKPFEWLDACCGPLEFHWVLLNSDRQNYFVLTWPMITGKELGEVKGTPGRKFTLFSIAIAPRIPIPRSVYSNWDKAIQKALSNSAPSHMGHGDVAKTFTSADSEVDSALDHDSISDSEKDKGKGKSVMAPTNPELSESDDSEIQIIAGRATSSTILRPAVASTSNVFSITSTDFGNGQCRCSSVQHCPSRLYSSDLPPLPVASYFRGDESGIALPVIGTWAAVKPTATQAQVASKRHASTVFETKTSSPDRGIRMSQVHELGSSIDSEFPQATASGSSTAMLPNRRPSSLHPAHKPT